MKQGYSGFHAKKNKSASTLIVVGIIHVAVAGGLWWFAQTEYGQALMKLYKINMMQAQQEEPPPPPEPEPEPEPEPQEVKEPEKPPPPPEPTEVAKPEPVPADAVPAKLPQVADPFAIGKKKKFSGYASILISMIQKYYTQPPDLQPGIPYAVLCQLIIDENGNVLNYQLLNSSGSPSFDDSALQALSKLTKVRKPPDNMANTIVVKFYPPT